MTGHQRGQSMVEFLVIVPLVMFSIFSCIQMALIFQTKTSLNYAVFQAARTAAVNRATLDAVHTGFAVGLTPHYTHGNSAEDMWAGRQEVENQIAAGWMRFTRISPSAEAFSDYGYEDAATELMSIPNDNLMYRNADSGSLPQDVSIQDANLLKVQVLYCYPVFLPLVGRFLADEAEYAEAIQARTTLPVYSTLRDESRSMDCRSRTGVNSIPLLASAIVRMQSDAVLDPAWDAQL